MIKSTVLYRYNKVVSKLSKVYGVSRQAIKDHFDDTNVELFYQIRKAYGRDYAYWMIKQSDIEECRHWLDTHKDELIKVEASREVKKPRNRCGYVLDNHKDEPLHFNTQREIADFLGYKATGFVIGRVYRGYEVKSGVSENTFILNTNTGESIPNHTIATDTISNTEVAESESEIQPLNTTVDCNDNSMCTQKSFEENLNLNTEVESNETIATDTTTSDIKVAEIPLSDLEADIKSDFESKVDAYFNKYYDLD